jgi:hypothetical protein
VVNPLIWISERGTDAEASYARIQISFTGEVLKKPALLCQEKFSILKRESLPHLTSVCRPRQSKEPRALPTAVMSLSTNLTVSARCPTVFCLFHQALCIRSLTDPRSNLRPNPWPLIALVRLGATWRINMFGTDSGSRSRFPGF